MILIYETRKHIVNAFSGSRVINLRFIRMKEAFTNAFTYHLF